MSPLSEDAVPRLAAVVFEVGENVDAVLHQTIAALRLQGVRVGGVVQAVGKRWTACRREMLVEDLQTGHLLKISQDLGAHAQGCILDQTALADVAVIFRAAMDRHPDVLIGNRFGEQEAEGRGLRAEFADAALGGFVLLTAVTTKYIGAWTEFGGDFAVTLAPSPQIVLDWTVRALASRPLTQVDAA
jgi:hypothetical protein